MEKGYQGPVEKAARLLTKAGAAMDGLCGGRHGQVEDLGWKPRMGWEEGAGVQDPCCLLVGSAGPSDGVCCHLSQEMA